MKRFNINDYIYIEITDCGWAYLQKTVGNSYIEACITPNKYLINGKVVYKLQCHQVFDLMPVDVGSMTLFKPTIMINEKDLV